MLLRRRTLRGRGRRLRRGRRRYLRLRRGLRRRRCTGWLRGRWPRRLAERRVAPLRLGQHRLDRVRRQGGGDTWSAAGETRPCDADHLTLVVEDRSAVGLERLVWSEQEHTVVDGRYRALLNHHR